MQPVYCMKDWQTLQYKTFCALIFFIFCLFFSVIASFYLLFSAFLSLFQWILNLSLPSLILWQPFTGQEPKQKASTTLRQAPSQLQPDWFSLQKPKQSPARLVRGRQASVFRPSPLLAGQASFAKFPTGRKRAGRACPQKTIQAPGPGGSPQNQDRSHSKGVALGLSAPSGSSQPPPNSVWPVAAAYGKKFFRIVLF